MALLAGAGALFGIGQSIYNNIQDRNQSNKLKKAQQDLLDELEAMNKTDKRAFFNSLNAQKNNAAELTQEEIDAQETAVMLKLRTLVGQLFGVTIPTNVTVNQIKTYMNNWITDNEVAISGFIPNVSAWEVEMVRQANAAGGDVKAYLIQCMKIKRHLGNIV